MDCPFWTILQPLTVSVSCVQRESPCDVTHPDELGSTTLCSRPNLNIAQLRVVPSLLYLCVTSFCSSFSVTILSGFLSFCLVFASHCRWSRLQFCPANSGWNHTYEYVVTTRNVLSASRARLHYLSKNLTLSELSLCKSIRIFLSVYLYAAACRFTDFHVFVHSCVEAYMYIEMPPRAANEYIEQHLTVSFILSTFRNG